MRVCVILCKLWASQLNICVSWWGTVAHSVPARVPVYGWQGPLAGCIVQGACEDQGAFPLNLLSVIPW